MRRAAWGWWAPQEESFAASATAAVHVYRGQEGELPEAFGVLEPESETVVEMSDPESGLYGARVFAPAGAVSGEGVLFIDEAVSPVGFPAEYREIGPAVGVNLQGATLQAPVEVTAPFSGSLLEFFRSRPGRVSLFIKEDGAADCPRPPSRRLLAVASGQRHYYYYFSLRAGSTLTTPVFGLNNGVHPKCQNRCDSSIEWNFTHSFTCPH